MLTNDRMRAGRYERQQIARNLYRMIIDNMMQGKQITVSTYLRTTVYDIRHKEMFKVEGQNVYTARGKKWDCIMGCKVRVH